jgi:hypothetical protein
MSATTQPTLPGTRTAPPKARVFLDGHRWAVTIPTPWGPTTYYAKSWPAAIRFLDLVTRRRTSVGVSR